MFGLVATVVGLTTGCGSLFSFNGRHPVAAVTIVPGTPVLQSLHVKAERRYTLAVQVVFDRESVPARDGAALVEAKLPLVASLETSRVVGFIDPQEPPTVLYGMASDPAQKQARGRDAELVAERLVGPYLAPGERDVAWSVDLGADKVGRARIQEARAVLYDDALPAAVKLAFGAAAAGVVALIAGLVMMVAGALRSRREGRGGARARPSV
ncbi:MAG: hypothetical protein JWP97_2960 [Labilithrix sp.]|nr:hypothetical protein [Labilithrix sp.]